VTVTAPTIGQPAWYYADHERVVNLMVVDHTGQHFPCTNVAVWHHDADDDKQATSHCELDPPVLDTKTGT
jgi:hypothetical protein